jgi:histone acetyltransferase 1
VYNFYAYPENIRPRIAQMLILPPFQKQGLAVELMSMIYRRYRTDKKAIEITGEPHQTCTLPYIYFIIFATMYVLITLHLHNSILTFLIFAVEDPSDDCEVLRDYVDARDCMKLLAFADENLRKGYSAEMTEQAKKELKITKVSLPK